MLQIRYAGIEDREFWFSLDKHLPAREYEQKIREKQCYLLLEEEQKIGVMRYNLFWDEHPFLTLIYFREDYRRKGYGSQALMYWENEMRSMGYTLVMTSTQSNEDAQHFYRKLGYRDAGCLLMVIEPYQQPLEIFLLKELSGC